MKSSVVAALSVLAAVLTLSLDQLTKLAAASRGILLLNAGGAFSIAHSVPGIVTWISVGVLVFFLLYYPKAVQEDKILIAFILGAGFSNVADRIVYGGVRDFMSLPWFAVFNVADVILTVATLLLVLRTLLRPPR